MLTSAFIRREIDAINEKWREIQKGSERKGEGLAIFYRLHIHPDLWRGIQEFLDTLSAEGREPFVFAEVKFLELTVNCDYSVEGWLILPIADGAQIIIGLAARRLHSMKFHAVAAAARRSILTALETLFSKYPSLDAAAGLAH